MSPEKVRAAVGAGRAQARTMQRLGVIDSAVLVYLGHLMPVRHQNSVLLISRTTPQVEVAIQAGPVIAPA